LDITKPYDVISRFYDDAVGCNDGRAQYVAALIEKYHPSAQTLLELGCGTGLVLEQLAPRYKVSGLDSSSNMLKRTAHRLPMSDFYLANMSDFHLPLCFDSIICIYDSLNHLCDFSSWRSVFALAKRHLNDDGVFIFDVNTQFKLQQLAQHSSAYPTLGDDYATALSRHFGQQHQHHMLVTIVDEGNGTTRWDISFYEQKGASDFQLSKDSFREISFPIDAIQCSLQSIFNTVVVWDRDNESITTRSMRVYFCAVWVCGSRRPRRRDPGARSGHGRGS